VKRKNHQTGVKKIQVFLSPSIFTCDIYYEITAPNILIIFSLFSFSYIEAWTRHGTICTFSNYHCFYEIVSYNVGLLCQKKLLVM